MKEGTKSVLFGCHNPVIHGIFVLLTWKLEYKVWPKWWELIGIFLHDIGVWGRQYLSNDTAKVGHWQRGAYWTSKIVSKLGGSARLSYSFVAGHCPEESYYPKSKLWKADKRVWLVTPIFILWWNYWVEWSGSGLGVTRPPLWRKLVEENLRKPEPIGNHELYMQHRGK